MVKRPHHYLTEVRLQHAQLMLGGGYSVAEVSFLVGFESTTSFTHLFKKYRGVAPSVYQAAQQEKTGFIPV